APPTESGNVPTSLRREAPLLEGRFPLSRLRIHAVAIDRMAPGQTGQPEGALGLGEGGAGRRRRRGGGPARGPGGLLLALCARPVGGRLLVLRAEDVRLRLSAHQAQELLALDGLAPEEDLGEPVEVVAVLGEDAPRAPVRVLDDVADLVVDLARHLV